MLPWRQFLLDVTFEASEEIGPQGSQQRSNLNTANKIAPKCQYHLAAIELSTLRH
jgi:hypothetical protein